MMPVKDSTERFSSRVENYVRYRPGYPEEIVDLLKKECGLTSESIIADIAFGTGLFTRLLLDNGNRVFGIEPNQKMRRAGEAFLAGYPRFTSVVGTAEATTLPDHSLDLATAAQAAHWFECAPARREFQRILKPGGRLALIWNERSVQADAFAREYENFVVKYGTDYQQMRHQSPQRSVEALFASSSYRVKEFATRQEFDYPALEGRLLSSSYSPLPDHPSYQPMLEQLQRIFHTHQIQGCVAFHYDTRVYFGRLQ
jgi:SAM-dependent methyltransferase